VFISRRPLVPGSLAETTPRTAGVKSLKESHVFDLTSQPRRDMRMGSSLQLATVKQFPASFNMSGAILHLEPGAKRSMHWHPNADEWEYVLNGSYDLSVFASEGQASVSSLKQGDVGYVPMGYGHALRNTAEGPTDILVVFNDGNYQTINLNEWLATNPASVLSNNLHIPKSLTDQLPKDNADFIPQ
jgi:oxalate decarboxylase